MSTNYYWKRKDEAQAQDEHHIALRTGHALTFQAHPKLGLIDFESFMRFLREGNFDIIDEYNRVLGLDEFERFADAFAKTQDSVSYANSVTLPKGQVPAHMQRYLDEQGHLFWNMAFS